MGRVLWVRCRKKCVVKQVSKNQQLSPSHAETCSHPDLHFPAAAVMHPPQAHQQPPHTIPRPAAARSQGSRAESASRRWSCARPGQGCENEIMHGVGMGSGEAGNYDTRAHANTSKRIPSTTLKPWEPVEYKNIKKTPFYTKIIHLYIVHSQK
jgi:hypothetical protein